MDNKIINMVKETTLKLSMNYNFELIIYIYIYDNSYLFLSSHQSSIIYMYTFLLEFRLFAKINIDYLLRLIYKKKKIF